MSNSEREELLGGCWIENDEVLKYAYLHYLFAQIERIKKHGIMGLWDDASPPKDGIYRLEAPARFTNSCKHTLTREMIIRSAQNQKEMLKNATHEERQLTYKIWSELWGEDLALATFQVHGINPITYEDCAPEECTQTS